MKKITLFLLVAVFSLVLSNCSTPFPSFIGITTQHISNSSNQSPNILSNQILRSGESCSWSSYFLLTLFYYGGGNSVEEAKENGRITKIAVIDRSSMSILGPLFYKECTIVWGE